MRRIDIIVKVGVSSQNMKEFLTSVINETIQNKQAMNGGASMSGISGNYGPTSSIMSGGTGYGSIRRTHTMN